MLRKGPVLSVSLPAPSPTPPSTISPYIVQAVRLEKLLKHHTCCGSVQAWLPHSLELLLPWPSLLAALSLGHEPYCLVSRPQPLWWDDPAGDISKTGLCGKSDCVWFEPHFPGWGPACSFSPPQAEATAALASLPTDAAAVLTSASPMLMQRPLATTAQQLWVSPDPRPVSPVISGLAPQTEGTPDGTFGTRGCLGPSCKNNTGWCLLLRPSLTCPRTLLGSGKTVTQSVLFPALSKAAPA